MTKNWQEKFLSENPNSTHNREKTKNSDKDLKVSRKNSLELEAISPLLKNKKTSDSKPDSKKSLKDTRMLPRESQD